ncbi:hypothetical protein DFH06DRAFT_1130429 [Mycena polygramma]|nr:hypothetical protein DFH06DRAFT_1130429 [Mycena polygramma]
MTFAHGSLKTLPKLPPSPFDRHYGQRRTKKGRSHASVQTVRERVETSRAEHVIAATSASPFAYVLLAQPGMCTCIATLSVISNTHPTVNTQRRGSASPTWDNTVRFLDWNR